jgi:hypothetical protein
VLAALPPLLASLMQLASAWLGRKLGKRREIIVFGALLQAATLIPLALLPLVFPELAVPLLILCAILYLPARTWARRNGAASWAIWCRKPIGAGSSPCVRGSRVSPTSRR